MNILALSTAEQGCSLALSADGVLVCEEFWNSRLTHSSRIMSMVAGMLESRAGIPPEAVDRFVAARGPGSFTGVRIGISTVLGLAQGLSRPAAGVSSLDGIAWQFSTSDIPICAMMDARRSEVYTAVYRFEGGVLVHKSREQALSPEQAVESAEPGAVFAGSGALAYRDLIMARTRNQAVIAPEMMSHVRAAALLQSIAGCPGIFESDSAGMAPVYLRKSDAEIQSAV